LSEAAVMLDAKLAAWVGRSTIATDILTPAMVDGFVAMLDREPIGEKAGTPAPQGIHWLCALPRVKAGDLAPDGHPHRGLLLPPVDLPRRMWAGSAIEFLAPLCVGDHIERRSTIAAITPKTGSSGPLVFVDVDYVVTAGGREALRERHTIVYRGLPDLKRRDASRAPRSAPAEAPAFARRVVPDPVLLFRYSALTFNAHRIHYDLSYATKVEGYPDLVVHGPLIATLLLDLAGRQYGENAVRRFSFRGLAPAFAGQVLELQGYPKGKDVVLQATTADGQLVVMAEASL
jgi:3-methylfumaryl-CoA hydratase